jgi:hypothetical protein
MQKQDVKMLDLNEKTQNPWRHLDRMKVSITQYTHSYLFGIIEILCVKYLHAAMHVYEGLRFNKNIEVI